MTKSLSSHIEKILRYSKLNTGIASCLRPVESYDDEIFDFWFSVKIDQTQFIGMLNFLSVTWHKRSSSSCHCTSWKANETKSFIGKHIILHQGTWRQSSTWPGDVRKPMYKHSANFHLPLQVLHIGQNRGSQSQSSCWAKSKRFASKRLIFG